MKNIHEEMKTFLLHNFTSFYLILFFYSLKFIIFNIDYSNNIISIYFTQKDRRNHLLVEYLSRSLL